MKNLKQQFCCLLACLAGILLAAPPSAAASVVIYDNGAPNHLSANNLGYARQADDFTLVCCSTVTDIHFWSLELDAAYRGSISWAILGDQGGAPGSLTLASGVQSAVTRTSLGSYLGMNEYRNDFNLNVPLSLGAGTFWLVLHNGSFNDLGDPNEFLWETANPNATTRGYESFDANHPAWSSNGNEHAFQITAVPEPMTALMLLAGVALTACMRRREQASDRFS
jgi:hypothetical protein